MKSLRTIFFMSIGAAILLAACKHHPDLDGLIGGNGGGNITLPPPDTVVVTNPDPCDPDSVYFNTQVLPLLISNCAQPDCHDAITHEEGIRLYDYEHIMASDVVEPGDPWDSEMIEMITEDDSDDVMPPPDAGGPLSAEEINILVTWIAQGAKNNSCTPDCDPAQFSFAANILPVVDMACQGCHSGNNPDGGLTLMTYDEIRTIALDGRLMKVLNGTDGYPIMPYNTLGLPECNKTQFQNWVNAGAPNN